MRLPRQLAAIAVFTAAAGGVPPSWAHTTANAGNEASKATEAVAMEAGTRDLQDLTPVRQIEMYLDGYHCYNSERGLPANKQRQVRVSHYCHHASPDFVQCVIYDGNTEDAHLIGIEYVISDKLFKTLPAGEKKYWHPHDGEVDSGMLIAPGIPAPVQNSLLGDLRTTHGKTWHVWQIDKDDFPYGEPQLMWAIDPKQINAKTKASMAARKKTATF